MTFSAQKDVYGVTNWGLQDNMNFKYGLGKHLDIIIIYYMVILSNAPFIRIAKAFINIVNSNINCHAAIMLKSCYLAQ